MEKKNTSLTRERMELYRKLGLKPTIVHKSGAMIIFPGGRVIKDDNIIKK